MGGSGDVLVKWLINTFTFVIQSFLAAAKFYSIENRMWILVRTLRNESVRPF